MKSKCVHKKQMPKAHQPYNISYFHAKRPSNEESISMQKMLCTLRGPSNEVSFSNINSSEIQ